MSYINFYFTDAKHPRNKEHVQIEGTLAGFSHNRQGFFNLAMNELVKRKQLQNTYFLGDENLRSASIIKKDGDTELVKYNLNISCQPHGDLETYIN